MKNEIVQIKGLGNEIILHSKCLFHRL